MTTSFAHFTEGQFAESLRANPAGLLLASFALLQIPWAWVSVARSRLWGVWRPEAALLGVLLAICALLSIQWILRLAW